MSSFLLTIHLQFATLLCKRLPTFAAEITKKTTMIQNLILDIWALLCEMSPYLLLGFLLAGLMHEFIPHRIYTEYLSAANLRSVLLAALFGIPLPLCSCGVLPTAMGLRREGASRGATVSFLIATPQTGVDSIVATYSLLGLPFTLIRPLAALVTALFGGALVNATDKPDVLLQVKEEAETCKDDCCCCHSQASEASSEGKRSMLTRVLSALRYAFVEMTGDMAKWLIIGLIIAGMITTLVPDTWFSVFKDNSPLSILLVLAISVPMYICATGSIPIAVALMMKGLTPGAALVLLMAGPACNVASMLVIRKILGNRAQWAYLAAIVSGAIVFGLVIDYLLPREWFVSDLVMQAHCCHATPELFEMGCAVLLLSLLILPMLRGQQQQESEKCACEDATKASTTFTVEGMTCSHCAASVERAIRATKGVSNVQVSVADKRAVVWGHFDEAEVKAAIECIGFKVKEGQKE